MKKKLVMAIIALLLFNVNNSNAIELSSDLKKLGILIDSNTQKIVENFYLQTEENVVIFDEGKNQEYNNFITAENYYALGEFFENRKEYKSAQQFYIKSYILNKYKIINLLACIRVSSILLENELALFYVKELLKIMEVKRNNKEVVH